MKTKQITLPALGALLLLTGWQLAGGMHLLGRTLPTPGEVFAIYAKGFRLALLMRSATATIAAASIGLCCGTLAGLAVAVIVHLFHALRDGLDRLAVLVNAVPVFFLRYMAGSTGLRQATDARLAQYLRTLGASRWQRLIRLEMPSAIPDLLSGLKTAVGNALIGAIVGEWFGAPRGLGVVIINAMQNFQIALMWAAVLLLAAIALASYALLDMLEAAVERRLR